MKKLLMIFLLVGISVSFYSCGNDDDEPTIDKRDILYGTYDYSTSGKIYFEYDDGSIEDFSSTDIFRSSNETGSSSYKCNLLSIRQDEDLYLMLSYINDTINPFFGRYVKTMLDLECDNILHFGPYKDFAFIKTKNSSTQKIELSHSDAVFNGKELTWTTTVSGYIVDHEIHINIGTISGSFTNKAVKR